jgi:selenocysteine lyase/cysteine desulfurase
MSPHFYNTDRELDHAVAAVEDILAEGCWSLN